MSLSSFYRIARNTMMMCFGNAEGQEGPSTEKIEEEFWNHVSKRKSHVCVYSGSIDTGTPGYGFSKTNRHPWNLKVLTKNSASILRFLGPVMGKSSVSQYNIIFSNAFWVYKMFWKNILSCFAGVTVPTLHVGMLYSACCWYRDPHGLPWIEYLHTGANKIWWENFLSLKSKISDPPNFKILFFSRTFINSVLIVSWKKSNSFSG